MMRDLGTGALPICGADDKLHGMITDRDLVVRCMAEGHDPTTMRVVEMATPGRPVMVGADDTLDAVLQAMVTNQVRRVLVLDDTSRLVGVVSQKELADSVEPARLGMVAAGVMAAEPMDPSAAQAATSSKSQQKQGLAR